MSACVCRAFYYYLVAPTKSYTEDLVRHFAVIGDRIAVLVAWWVDYGEMRMELRCEDQHRHQGMSWTVSRQHAYATPQEIIKCLYSQR